MNRINPLFLQICDAFDLGKPITPAIRVHGGLLHRMWKITTAKDSYAIKELAEHIDFTSERIARNYELTEEVARHFGEMGIPVVSALSHHGQHLIEIEGRFFLIYPWVEGKVLHQDQVSEVHALKIAKLLAKIHRINLESRDIAESDSEPYTTARLLALIRKAEDFDLPFSQALKDQQDELIAILDAYQDATHLLKKQVVMTHGDLDQKNVLWDHADQPILIDWESARKLNPTYDIVNVSLYWSGITSDAFDPTLFVKMIQAYIAAGGSIDPTLLQAAFDGACGWIHWMIHNVERACVHGESEEKKAAIQQVNQTLQTMARLRRVTPNLVKRLARCHKTS